MSHPCKQSVLAAALAGAVWLAQPAACAQQAEQAALPLWELGVIAGTVSMPAYPGSADTSSRTLALPLLIYRGKVLRSDRSGIGARLLRTDRLEFDVGFAASLPAFSTDVAARSGMPDLGTLVEFGPRIKFRLAELAPSVHLRFEAPLRSVIEVRGGLRRKGWTFEPKLVYEKVAPHDAWNADVTLAALLGDTAINRYFYQVDPAFATPQRPAYRAKGGLMLLRAGVSGSLELYRDLRLYGFLRYDSYASAANRISPLMQKGSGASAGIGFAWTLGRSKTLASPEPAPSFDTFD
jgi:outer membrane protein